jgi:hypothetical protein
MRTSNFNWYSCWLVAIAAAACAPAAKRTADGSAALDAPTPDALGEGGAGTGGGASSDAEAAVWNVCVAEGRTTGPFCDLVVQGERFERLEGIHAYVQTGEPPTQRRGSAETRVREGRFAVTIPAVQELNIIYKLVTVLFDVDGDGACSPADELIRWQTVRILPADGGGSACSGTVVVTSTSIMSISAAPSACAQLGSVCDMPDGRSPD